MKRVELVSEKVWGINNSGKAIMKQISYIEDSIFIKIVDKILNSGSNEFGARICWI